jgi:hypothetical protein
MGTRSCTRSQIQARMETCGSCHCQATGSHFHCSTRRSLNPTPRSRPTGSGLRTGRIKTAAWRSTCSRFPADRQWQVSTNGGYFTMAARRARAVLHVSELPRQMLAVDVSRGAQNLEAGAPRDNDSPTQPSAPGGGRYHTYAVSTDGKRFLIPYPPSSVRPT